MWQKLDGNSKSLATHLQRKIIFPFYILESEIWNHFFTPNTNRIFSISCLEYDVIEMSYDMSNPEHHIACHSLISHKAKKTFADPCIPQECATPNPSTNHGNLAPVSYTVHEHVSAPKYEPTNQTFQTQENLSYTGCECWRSVSKMLHTVTKSLRTPQLSQPRYSMRWP